MRLDETVSFLHALSMRVPRRRKVLGVRGVFAGLVLIALVFFGMLLAWAVGLAGVATSVTEMQLQAVVVGDTCDSIT